MKKVLALLLALLMVISLGACKTPEKTTEEPQKQEEWYMWDKAHPERYGGTIRAQYGDWSPTWDPYGQASWTTYFWAIPAFQSCLVLGDDGKVYPQICTYEMSEDGKTIKLTIRDGVKFSDGTEVTTDDIIASLQRSGKLIANTNTYLWDILDHYDVAGKTITWYFKEYNSSTLRTIFADPRNANRAIMKKEICEKYGENLIEDVNDLIGTGPYKFVVNECETEKKATYVRNEYYLPNLDNPEDNGIASPNYQYADKLVMMNLSGTETVFMALANNELDAGSSTATETFDTMLKPLGKFKMEPYNSAGTYYCFLNCKEGPMADPNLRKAIAAAFDYMEVAVTMYGPLAQLQDSILVKGVYKEYYERDNYRKQDWFGGSNMEVAKKYLAASNYNGEVLKLTGYQDSFMPALKYFDELGLKYTWTKLDNATLRGYAQDETQTDKWDLVYRPNPLASSPDGWTYTFFDPWSWGNPHALELLNQLKSVPYDTEESFKIWDELNVEICNDCPWIIIMVQPHCAVCPTTLHLRRNIDEYWYHMGYWDDPENHNN